MALSAFLLYRNNQLSQRLVKYDSLLFQNDPEEVPKVIYLAEATFTEKEKAILQERITNPLVDYYSTTEPEEVVLIVFKKGYKDLKDYTYGVTTYFKRGVVESTLIPETNGLVDWYTPCVIYCEYSEEFKIKYPEIVNNLEKEGYSP